MTHRLDPRKPLVFDTRALGRRAGSMEETAREVTLPEVVGTDVIGIQPGTPIEVALRLESVMEGVLASGTVRAIARGACVRCLEDVDLPIEVDVQELFEYADRASHLTEVGDDDDERHVLEGDLLDLEGTLRDAVVPALPFQPVCRPDCPGLCSECGQLLADDPGHAHENIDPRWAALAQVAAPGTEEKRN